MPAKCPRDAFADFSPVARRNMPQCTWGRFKMSYAFNPRQIDTVKTLCGAPTIVHPVFEPHLAEGMDHESNDT